MSCSGPLSQSEQELNIIYKAVVKLLKRKYFLCDAPIKYIFAKNCVIKNRRKLYKKLKELIKEIIDEANSENF